LGLFYTLSIMVWPITGNQGTTWSQFLPPILVGIGVTAVGF